MDPPEPPKAVKAWFQKIDRIDIEITLQAPVTDEKKALIREIPFKVITFVRPAQVNVSLQTLPATPQVVINGATHVLGVRAPAEFPRVARGDQGERVAAPEQRKRPLDLLHRHLSRRSERDHDPPRKPSSLPQPLDQLPPLGPLAAHPGVHTEPQA